MRPLHDARVLFISDDARDAHQISIWLQSEGAHVDVRTWSDELTAVERAAPTVLIADLRTRRAEAEQHLQQAAGAAYFGVPIVALVPVTASSAAPSNAVLSVNKYLTAPLHPADLINTVVSLKLAATAPSRAPAPEPAHATMYAELLRARAEQRDFRGVLRLLNATGPFRFTSILRFDGDERLTSVWTFDRDNPDVDSFPSDKRVLDSYCSRVLATGAPFLMPDAALEPSVQNHPARFAVLSYCGVPIHGRDGSVYGTLCQFDVVPRYFLPNVVERLSLAAEILQDVLPTLGPT